MSSRPPSKVPRKVNTFAIALTRIAAIGILLVLSLATWAYRHSLEPQYGTAPVRLHLSKIVWSASILGSFAPTVPIGYATLALSGLLYALPHSSYWVAAYTARMGDPTWGPIATHLLVLLPILALGVAIIKALQDASYNGEEENASLQSTITLPVCATAINSLQGLWPSIGYVAAISDSQVILNLGTACASLWAISAYLPDVRAPLPSAKAVPVPVQPIPESKGKRKKNTPEKSASVAPPPLPKHFQRKSGGLVKLRIAILPFLPYLTRTVFRPPTLPQPLLKPWNHPTYPLRILSSVQSAYSGVVVVGESVASEAGGSRGIDNLRYLRAGHSLLGGVWVGPKAQALDPKLLLEDEAGEKLGDTIYSAFVLQEAALLAKKQPKTALNIGLGTGIAVTSFMRHGLDTTIVEIDPAVYEAARTYFGLPRSPPDRVFIQDAKGWVHNISQTIGAGSDGTRAKLPISERFDIVVHDCFTGGGVPSYLYTQQFWQNLKKIVQPDAVIAVNYAGIISSNSAKAIILTLKSVFPQCRAFYDSMEPSVDALNEFQNWVFFCTPSSEQLVFRKAVSSDYLGSYLRKHILSSLPDREGDISKVGDDIPEDKRERFILTDAWNPLSEWQQKDAMAHWKIMRGVLPDVFWETY